MNVKPGSLYDWGHLVSSLKTKFSYAEAKSTLAWLGRTSQHSDEDLDVNLKYFHEKELDCCNPVADDAMVDVCLNGIIECYRVLSFSSFFRLLEVERRRNESIKRTVKSDAAIGTMLKNRLTMATIKKSKRAKGSNSKKISHYKRI